MSARMTKKPIRITCTACNGEGVVPTASLWHRANVLPSDETRSYCEACAGAGSYTFAAYELDEDDP